MHHSRNIEKPQNIKKTLKELFKYFKDYKLKMIVVIIFAMSSTIFAIAGPKILARATDKIVDGYVEIKIYEQVKENMPEDFDMSLLSGEDVINMMPKDQLKEDQVKIIKNMDFSKRPSIDFSFIKDILFLCLGIYLLSSLFNYIQSYIIADVSQKITYDLRDKIFKKFDKVPLKYYDKTNNGDLLSRVTNDVDTLSHTISQNLSQAIALVTSLIGILIMMITINGMMTLVAILILPLSMVFIKNVATRSQKYFQEQQTKLGKLNGHIEEYYAGITVVKAFNNEEKSIDKFNEYNKDLCESSWKSQFYSGIMMPIINFVGNIGYVAVCVLGGYYVTKKRVSVGDVQAFIVYLRNFNQNAGQIATVVGNFQTTLAACERIFEFLDVPEEVKDKKDAITKEVEGNVVFKNVKFGYDEDKIIIKNFNLDVKKGDKVAIVGPTGAGKTTLVKLLMRFYDINSGEIKIDGINIKDYKRSSLRRNFGMVLQDSWLFSGSILENIKYGNIKASEEEIKEACKKARIDHVIETLPGGYDYEINEEGTNISAGEKQLLTIARAILADPNILILDEATSSVDTRTEVLINEAMKNLMKNRTSFIIAHRLSTIRNASKIIVMNEGDIVEVGNHEELLKKKGFYYKLYNSQFEGNE